MLNSFRFTATRLSSNKTNAIGGLFSFRSFAVQHSAADSKQFLRLKSSSTRSNSLNQSKFVVAQPMLLTGKSNNKNLFRFATMSNRYQRTFSTESTSTIGGKDGTFREKAEEFAETYARPLQWMHLIGAVGITFCIFSALIAGQIPNDPKKTSKAKLEFRGKLMHLHESVGLLMLAAMVPRIGARLLTRIPKPLPVPTWQHYAANVSHAALYGVLVFMPVSGLAFGYFSCWGVPFFYWQVPGAPKEKYGDTYKALEKFFYENHHRVGNILTWYLFPAHVGAVAFHYLFRGHNLLRRMNPFGKQIRH